MAIKLSSKANVVAPGGDYPFGRIKNDTGSGDGTPVDVQVYGDIHQFFEKLMNAAGVTHNDLPDNSANGFQFFTALETLIGSGAWTNGVSTAGGGATVSNLYHNRYKIIGKTFYWEFSAELATSPTSTTCTLSFPTSITPKHTSFNYKPIVVNSGSSTYSDDIAKCSIEATRITIMSPGLASTSGNPVVSFTLVFELN